ncbi:MAG: UvrD-helicase domain-containing protein [Planctomycetota bacterium]|jgi:ATP-dependent helicase/nuclease subunit A
MAQILDYLRPFVLGFREEYARRGYVSLHGLLVKAADLLRGSREIRAHFKERFRVILVDEFQDTDPLQGEILLYLAEKRGRFAARWEDVAVEEGKLIIVGDPKQSIYLFRGADLEAYMMILNRLTAGGRNVERLSMNHRSRKEVIDYVNAACADIMGVPQYEKIEPSPDRGGGGKVEGLFFGDMKAGEAREAEAGAVADWILGEKLRFGDVAILLRSLKDSHYYTGALRAKGIPFAIEGEKTFWQVPEVIDFVNLLTAIAHPTHEPAVVGLLRSPLGAVADRDLLHLRDAGALCPLDAAKVPEKQGHVRRLFEALADLHRLSRRLRTAELVRRALERLPLREVWAAGFRGEQAVANIEKLVTDISAEDAPLDAAIEEARRRSRELEEEGESPLADEKLDAVRILSIHKAKGLEFPVVVLADLHRDRVRGGEGPVVREWLTGRVGMRVGSVQNTERYLVETARAQRRREEEVRLLYVALTRARERLLLTGGRASKGNYVEHLRGVPGLGEIDAPEPRPRVAPAAPAEEPDPAAERRRWAEREAAARAAAESRPIRNPSVSAEDVSLDERWERAGDEPGGRELGVVCHDILAKIDLANPPRVEGEAGKILNPFFKSDAFREIAAAEEVHREIPFLVELDGQVWSGQIDVLYRRDGAWVVADFKTDREKKPDRYLQQKKVYTAAVQRLFGLKDPPEFRLVYLRSSSIFSGS